MTAADHVRAAIPGDEAAFLAMWEDFVAFDPEEPGDRGMGACNWARVMDDGCPMNCLIAVDADGHPQGFLLYLAFPFTWSRGDVCYLQDISVRAGARGKGYALAMIRHLESVGRERGWFKIFWMTQPDNAPARRLYERIGLRRDYIRYDLMITD